MQIGPYSLYGGCFCSKTILKVNRFGLFFNRDLFIN